MLASAVSSGLALGIAIALAVFVIGASAAVQFARKQHGMRRFSSLELKPNCLLTRYPIAFLSGPRSLFRFLDHWNDVPLFLREHGYEVLVIEAVGRTPLVRAQAAASALSATNTRCHLVADASLERELQLIAEMGLKEITSLSLVKNQQRVRRLTTSRASLISITDLKPLKSAIEVFEMSSHPDGRGFNFGFDSERPSFLELAARALLTCHNFAIRKRSLAVDALETAEYGAFRGFRNEERFLDLAVSLAERDFAGFEHR